MFPFLHPANKSIVAVFSFLDPHEKETQNFPATLAFGIDPQVFSFIFLLAILQQRGYVFL